MVPDQPASQPSSRNTITVIPNVYCWTTAGPPFYQDPTAPPPPSVDLRPLHPAAYGAASSPFRVLAAVATSTGPADHSTHRPSVYTHSQCLLCLPYPAEHQHRRASLSLITHLTPSCILQPLCLPPATAQFPGTSPPTPSPPHGRRQRQPPRNRTFEAHRHGPHTT